MGARQMGLMPDDWSSALDACRHALGSVRRSRRITARHALGLAGPLLVGAVPGWVLAPAFLALEGAGPAFVMRAVLTLMGVLCGFMFAVLLFTGRTDHTQHLSYEEAREFRDKVIYLLWSQIESLMCFLATAVVAIAWLVVRIAAAAPLAMQGLTALAVGLLVLSLVRALLLPWQVYELHQFGLDVMLRSKQREIDETIRSRHNQTG